MFPCSVLRKVAAEIPSFIFITPAIEQSHSKRLSSLHILLSPSQATIDIYSICFCMMGKRKTSHRLVSSARRAWRHYSKAFLYKSIRVSRYYILIVCSSILMGRLYKYSYKKVRIYLCSDFAKDGASKYIRTFFTRLSKQNWAPSK